MRAVYLITVVLVVFSAAYCDSDDNVLDAFGTLPLYFIENRGQLDGDADFYVKGSDKTLYFTSEGVTFALAGKEDVDETFQVPLLITV